MVELYHEFSHPYEMMQSICKALKPGGRVAFVRYRAENPEIPIKRLHKMSEAQVREEMALQPLVWVETLEVLPLQHIVFFQKKARTMTKSQFKELISLARTGRMVEAIGRYRQLTGVGLAIGKRIVQTLARALPQTGQSDGRVWELLQMARNGVANEAGKELARLIGDDTDAAAAIVECSIRGAPAIPSQAERKKLTLGLIDAVRSGDQNGVEEALQAGASASGWAGLTNPLLVAVERGDAVLAELLLKHGAQTERSGAEETPPLLAALARADYLMAKLLLAHGALAGVRASHGPFPTAVRALVAGPEDDLDLLRQLLGRNAIPEATDLGIAIAKGYDQIAAEIVAFGVDLNKVEQGSLTPLMEAARAGSWRWVEKLLEHGALMNLRDRDGNTALHRAALSKVDPCEKLRVLLERGADLSALNRLHQTPAAAALAVGRTVIASFVEEIGAASGPKWMREARARQIALIRFVWDKGAGIAFNPNDVECPILYGGDYDGPRPMSATRALDEFQKDLSGSSVLAASWPFLPFLEKLARGEDFSLALLEKACASRVEHHRA